MSIVRMTPSELDLKLRSLLSQERNTEADFLVHLLAFSDAKGHESLGYPKLWSYLREELGLLEGAIWRRVTAMEVLRRYPGAADRLRAGRLSMTALAMIEPVITRENASEILDKTAGKSTREIEFLVACMKEPVAGKDATIRRLPVPAPRERRGQAKPLSADQYSVQLIVRKEFIEKLERVKQIFGHKVPSGSLEGVLLEALEMVIRREEKKLAVRKPKSTPAVVPETPRPPDPFAQWKRDPISAALKALVFARDGRKCSWKLANGKTCSSRHCLEVDHIFPVAKGGLSTLENLRVVCRAHNQMHARNEFGAKFMERFSRKGTTSGAGGAATLRP